MPNVTFGDNVPGYVAKPANASKAGLIVIQEWWGLNNQIKKMADRFAKEGFVSLSPDFYRGQVATKPDEASHLMNGLDWPRAVEDIKQGALYLKSQGCDKVGVIGFCMGGALTIAAAVKCPEVLAAGSCFYGIPPATFADPKHIGIPMQFHFGDKDHSKGFSDKAAADHLKQTLKSVGKDVSEFHQYADGDHAFMNEEAPAYPYNEKVAKVAFQKAVDFFKKQLL